MKVYILKLGVSGIITGQKISYSGGAYEKYATRTKVNIVNSGIFFKSEMDYDYGGDETLGIIVKKDGKN